MKFQVIFTYDEEYKGYVADVPALPGCMSQGKTMDEAVASITEAIRGVLTTMERNDHPFRPDSYPAFVGEIAV